MEARARLHCPCTRSKATYRFGEERSIIFFFGSCDIQMSLTENLKPYNKGLEGQVLKKRCDKI
jgi:hypothetical protein